MKRSRCTAAICGSWLIRGLAVTTALVLTLFSPPARADEHPRPLRILALYWYGKDTPVNIRLNQIMEAAFKLAPAGSVEYYAEYQESNRFPGESQSQLLRDYLIRKYADHKIDVIIAISSTSLDFLLKYRQELFPDVPIVFHTRVNPDLTNRYGTAGFSGVLSPNTFSNTLDLTLRLHPATRRAFIITGEPEHSRSLELEVQAELMKFEDKVAITYLTNLPLDELISRVKSVPQNSIILFIRYSVDEPGKRLKPDDIVALLGQVAPVPVYGVSDTYVANGCVGGYAADVEACGKKAVEIALRIADGERPETIPVATVEPVPIFDWRQLQRWGISEQQLPPESIVRFKEPTFLEEHKWRIIFGLSLVAFEAALIAFLLIERKKRRRANRDLDERLRFEMLLSELSADFTRLLPQEVDGKIQEWLKRLVEFVGADRGGVLELSNDGRISEIGHSHTAVGNDPIPNELLNEPLDWYVGRLRRGELLNFSGKERGLPKEAEGERRYTSRFGLKSHLAIPIRSEDSVHYAITFTALHGYRDWSDELASRLRVAGEIFVNALTRKRVEEALTRLNTELESRVGERTAALNSKTRELETFAYSVAHDLKAPLRGIDGYSRLLLEDYLQTLDEDGRTLLTTIRYSTDHMTQLIDDLLAYSRLERRELAINSIDLRPLIDRIVGERRREMKERRIELDVSVNGASVMADVNGLVQTLRNYLDNAIKFTSGRDDPRIEIGAVEDQDKCRVWVRDNGIGFDMKYHDRIFEVFQRLHRAEDYPGTGVGLAMVRKAIERMGGRVWAESTPGEGASFFLEIPSHASSVAVTRRTQ